MHLLSNNTCTLTPIVTVTVAVAESPDKVILLTFMNRLSGKEDDSKVTMHAK